MWREFGNNVCETLAALVIGSVPILTHAIAYFSFQNAKNYEAGWTAEVLFIAITTAGTTAAQTGFRLVGPLRHSDPGRSPVLLIVFSVVILTLAGFLFGAVATGMARPDAINAALLLLAGAALAAFSTDLVIAQRMGEALDRNAN